MKLTAAAIQMPSIQGDPVRNLAKADERLAEAHAAGAAIAVLPEMVFSGYGLIPDYAPLSETVEGPTLTHLRERSRQWKMAIASGFVERDGSHLYDSLALCLPDGRCTVYRKQNLVFWERFRFKPGRQSVIAETPFGRIGLTICADMIFRHVWEGFRGTIDLAIISAAWPDFACRETGQKHWLFGHVGPLSASIPAKVAEDLGIPVIFANQVGETKTQIPYLGTWITDKIADRFSGKSCIADGRHGAAVIAGSGDQTVFSEITIHPQKGLRTWRSMYRSGSAASSSDLEPIGLASKPFGSIAARAVSVP